MSAPRQKPTVPEVLPLAQAIYDSENGGAGCCLHIVLDDSNLEDCFVDFCIQSAVENNHPHCERVARLLRRMSRTQRGKIAGLAGRRWPFVMRHPDLSRLVSDRQPR